MGLENCKFPLKMPQGMPDTLLEGQWLTIEALGTLVEQSLKRIQMASVFSVMADECTDITVVKELSVFCRWEEDGTPVQCHVDIVPLKKADAESIYVALSSASETKIFRLAILMGWVLMVQPPSLVKDGVQARQETCSTCSVCPRHLLQLACGQAANSTTGIKHGADHSLEVSSLTTLLKRAESLKEILHVLNLPEMKVIQPPDTR